MWSRQQLLGRGDEWAALLRVLDEPEAPPRITVLHGEAGIGKTAIWQAATEAATARGYSALVSRPSEVEATFSFAGLSDLIGASAQALLPELPRPQRRALEAALALSEGDDTVEQSVLGFAFLAVLRRLAERGPVLLAVDDVQWLDGPSLDVIRFALSRLDSTKVAALLTVRGELPDWLRRLPEDQVLGIELGPLSLGALHELVRSRLSISLPRPTLLRVWETSHGNPFFALELARALRRRGLRAEPGEELPIPGILEELVRERLALLTDDGMAVAAVAAALTAPTLALVETAEPQRAQAGLPDAVDAEILELDGDRVRFSHPFLRAAVAERSAPGRHALHARLAGLVTSPEERARHLALAARGPDPEVAAALESAAEAARRRGATASAADLADLALKLTPPADAESVRRRVIVTAERHLEAGDADHALALLRKALGTAPPGTARARILLELGRVTANARGPLLSVGLYHEALAETGGDDALEAEIRLSLAEVMRYTPDTDGALEHAAVAVRVAARAGDPALRCRALATYGFLHFRLGRGVPASEMREALTLERSLPDWPLSAPATEVRAHQLVWSGKVDQARRFLDEWHTALSALEDRSAETALWYLSILEWRAGNWEIAARHAAASLGVSIQFGTVGSRASAEFPAAVIAAHQGHLAEALARSQRFVEEGESGNGQLADLGHRWVLGFIALSRGDARAALPQLRRSWAVRDEIGILEPGHRVELGDTLEALIEVGDLDEADERLAPWEERSAVLDRAWALAITARCRGLLSAARGDLDGAFGQFERALAEHARSEDPFQHARTLLALGATLRRAKQRGVARARLEEAVRIFEQLGAPLWAAKARAEIGRIGGRTKSDGLTPTEARLAELVVEGLTDKEIAARLFVTPKTVGTNLSRIYAKVGVHSRTELAHRLADPGGGRSKV